MSQFQFKTLLLTALLFICFYITHGQNVEWVFHAKGIGTAPLIPTVQNTLAKDADGNLYMTSSVADSTQFGPFAIHGTEVLPGAGIFLNASYLSKFNAQGEPQWVKTFEGTGILGILDIETDQNGDVVMGGVIQGAIMIDTIPLATTLNSVSELFLAKFNSDGEVIWAIMDDGVGFAVSDISSLAISPSGNIIVGGTSGDRLFMGSFNGDGVLNWGRVYGNINQIMTRCGIAVDASNDIYWVGSTGTTVSSDFTTFDTITFKPYGGSMFVSKYNSDGDITWLRHYGEDSLSTARIASFNIEVGGNGLYIGGDFTDTINIGGTVLTEPIITGTHLFAIKYDLAGNIEWVKQSHGPANGVDVFDISTNDNGDLFIGGRAGNSNGLSSFVVGEGNHEASIVIDGSWNGFLAKYKSDGELDWIKGMRGFDESEVRAVVTTGENTAVISGIIKGTVQIGDSSLTTTPTSGASNVILTSWDGSASSTGIGPEIIENGVKIYPNPSEDQLFIEFENVSKFESVKLLDLQGRILQEVNNLQPLQRLSVKHLPAGVYLIQAKGKNGVFNQKIVRE